MGFAQEIIYALRTGNMWYLVVGILSLVAAVLSIMLHEIAHGFAAWKNGDATAKYYGRLTLNPVKHFDLMGFLCFAFVGIGWAKPVPVDSSNFRNYRKGLFWVSAAGVLTNIVLAFVSIPLALLCSMWAGASNMILPDILGAFFTSMYSVNLVLAVFNLIPIYPLDGFHVIESAMKRGRRFKAFMYEYGRALLLAFLIIVFFVSSFFGFSVLGWLAEWLAWPMLQFWGLFF